MKLTGTIKAEVEVNPREVINNLIIEHIGKYGIIFSANGHYYIQPDYYGDGEPEESFEVDRDLYMYIDSLRKVQYYMTLKRIKDEKKK